MHLIGVEWARKSVQATLQAPSMSVLPLAMVSLGVSPILQVSELSSLSMCYWHVKKYTKSTLPPTTFLVLFIGVGFFASVYTFNSLLLRWSDRLLLSYFDILHCV